MTWKRCSKSVTDSCTKTGQEDISMGNGGTPNYLGAKGTHIRTLKKIKIFVCFPLFRPKWGLEEIPRKKKIPKFRVKFWQNEAVGVNI